MEHFSYNNSQNRKQMLFGKLFTSFGYVIALFAFLALGFLAYQKLYVANFSQVAKQNKYIDAASSAEGELVAAPDGSPLLPSGNNASFGGGESADTEDEDSAISSYELDADDTYSEDYTDESESWDEPAPLPGQKTGSDGDSGTGSSNESTVSPTPTTPTAPSTPVISIPVAPAAPALSSTSASQITATWKPVAGATQYRLTYSASSSFGQASEITAGATSANITGLSASTTYYVKIRAINSAGLSNFSGVSKTTTLKYIPPAPSTPSGVKAAAPTLSGFTVSWNPATNATQYILRVTASDKVASAKEYAPTRSTKYSLSDLQTGKAYYVQVRASNNGTLGPWSIAVSYNTKFTYPSSLSLNVVSSSQINASWSAVSGAKTYSVRYSTSSAMTDAKAINTGTTSAALSGLTPNKTYYVQVNAGTAPWTSDWKKAGSITTKARFDLKIGTYNIGSQYLDDRYDKELKWASRKPRVTKIIQNNGFDAIGLQETTKTQRSDLLNSLTGYGATKFTGTWLGDNTILYKKSSLTLVKEGEFKISSAWPKKKGSTYTSSDRFGDWALFKHIATGKHFYVFNTHLQSRHTDDKDTATFVKANRSGAVELIKGIEKINSGKIPAFITGDFNSVSKAAGEPYATITGAGFVDSLTKTPASARTNTEYNSYNGFKAAKKDGYHIDKVFYRSNTTALSAKLIMDTFNGQYASDHFPYLTNVRIEL